jgi:Flp pilus assembly protein TadD
MAIVALLLGGCSSTGVATVGAFGDAPLQAADIPNLSAYDAGRALSEAQAHFRIGDFGYSAALYKRYVELTPNDPQGYVGLAASYDRLRRFDLSDRVYAAWFRLTGATAQYYNNLGYSYLLRGDTATALTNLRKADALDPHNPTVANNLKMLANAVKRT